MALREHTTVGNDMLEEWKILGSGGFGRVYQAWHNKYMFNVAIKLLDVDVSCSRSTLALREEELSNEVNNMDKVSCQFVLMVYGIFDGIPPFDDYLRKTEGIVMEYMPRGSIETLQENLDGPPPEPLAFRLAYEVALGINFLHERKLVHQDLKPSNVLLTEDFHAKLADFGLSIVSASAKDSDRQTTGDVGGTYKYMPPEALLDISYEPHCDFDIYSYGIFLWSLFTGKEPYPGARRDLVEFKVGKQGQRPPCKGLRQDLVVLMNKCWAHTPSERPKSNYCVGETKRIFSEHEKRIHDAVGQVLRELDADSTESLPPPGQAHSYDEVDTIESAEVDTIESATQPSDSDSADTMSAEDKAKFVEDNMPEIIQEAKEVMKIVDELKTKGMISSHQYAEIDGIPEQDKKMRRLYIHTALRSVDTVKAAFYTALKKNDPALVRRLGGS